MQPSLSNAVVSFLVHYYSAQTVDVLPVRPFRSLRRIRTRQQITTLSEAEG